MHPRFSMTGYVLVHFWAIVTQFGRSGCSEWRTFACVSRQPPRRPDLRPGQLCQRGKARRVLAFSGCG